MIRLEVKVKLPFLWGRSVFKKDIWSHINLIVGPNGSGKTLLAENIAGQFERSGYKVKFLRSDRSSSSEEFLILQNDAHIREKLQTVLSNMFGKSIVFKQKPDGDYVPVVVNKAWNVEYDLQQVECHGLKEIITLLVQLYANHGNACVIFDEPELHLHPQFQQFFMEELRKVSSRHPTRIYFLITHSPFFIDLRAPEELLGVVACHVNREPTHIAELSPEDSELFRKFLPRFNPYHKQFFFSDNQIFVEGYTDQQIFTNLLPFIGKEYASAGTGIIDVGGKDELGVFCKVCSLLGTNGKIITDLDSLFSGKLRDVFCRDKSAQEWLLKQQEKQAHFYESIFSARELKRQVTLESLILRLEKFLSEIGKEICQSDKSPPKGAELFFERLLMINEKHEKAETIDTFKTVVLQGITVCEKELQDFLMPQSARSLPLVKNLFALILAATEAAGVYILPDGCIEHYYTQNKIEYMPVAAKDRLFHTELEYIRNLSPQEAENKYGDIITILGRACVKNSR